jgi:hypothetical protein
MGLLTVQPCILFYLPWNLRKTQTHSVLKSEALYYRLFESYDTSREYVVVTMVIEEIILVIILNIKYQQPEEIG